MRKYLAILLVLPMLACQPIEKSARDTAAALAGSIQAAQAQFGPPCMGNPSQSICTEIDRGVALQNALITAIETYCGWSVGTPPSDPNSVCVPVKSAVQALRVAISNAGAMTTELRSAIVTAKGGK